MNKFLVTYIRTRAHMRGGLIIEPDCRMLGPNWPIDDPTMEDVVSYLSTRGFYDTVYNCWVLPGAILSVKEIQAKKQPKEEATISTAAGE